MEVLSDFTTRILQFGSTEYWRREQHDQSRFQLQAASPRRMRSEGAREDRGFCATCAACGGKRGRGEGGRWLIDCERLWADGSTPGKDSAVFDKDKPIRLQDAASHPIKAIAMVEGPQAAQYRASDGVSSAMCLRGIMHAWTMGRLRREAGGL